MVPADIKSCPSCLVSVTKKFNNTLLSLNATKMKGPS